MSKYIGAFNRLKKIAGYAAVGGTAGYITGHVVSDVTGAEKAGKLGAKIGVTTGVVAGLPHARIAKAVAAEAKVYATGLKATKGSKIGSALNKAEYAGRKASVGGRWVFRKIRGKIRRIFVK